MEQGPIGYEVQDSIALVTIQRPKRRNALSSAAVEGLLTSLDAVERDSGVRVVVLTGAGTVFCAGGDLADGLASGDGFLATHRGRGRYAELLARLPRLRVPVIAAVNGDALGGGLGLVAACDLAVADANARLGTPEVRIGVFPMIILAALQRLVPRKALLEMIFAGNRISAERALELGLINRVAEAGTALDVALELGRTLASRSPAALSLGKEAFYRVADLPYEDALAYLHSQLSLTLLTEDAQEGIAAFLQKREPNWKGR